jgi:hypothetical protein
MKILITGTAGLAHALAQAHCNDQVTAVSRQTGHNINQVQAWGQEFLDYDRVYNCAYDGIGQQLVLEFFYQYWKNLQPKSIVTIGSKAITQPRIKLDQDHQYWPYRAHKQTLQLMHDQMWPTAKCDLKIINPGAIDTHMVQAHNIPKMAPELLAEKIKNFCQDPINKRLDLWL